MKLTSWILVFFGFLPVLLNAEDSKILKKLEAHVERSIDFILSSAWDDELGCLYSDLDQEGHVLDKKVYLVSLNRSLYALSYFSEIRPDYLPIAKQIAFFLMQNMVSMDETYGNEFVMLLDDGNLIPNPDALHIWQQSYGFCGLVEYYRVSRDMEVIDFIRIMLPGYLKRFQDLPEGGFTLSFERQSGPEMEKKSIQSIMYPMTAFFINLWEADASGKDLYESILAQQSELAYQHGWNQDTGWVNVNFDRTYRPIEGATISPGHNFQLAATLLRAASWNFLEDEQRELYRERALMILRKTLESSAWDKSQASEMSFYEAISSETGEILSHQKSWWQHCEAIIATHLAGEEFESIKLKLLRFYLSNFCDEQYGGDFTSIDSQNQPVYPVMKGSQGQSVYHVTEMFRILSEDPFTLTEE